MEMTKAPLLKKQGRLALLISASSNDAGRGKPPQLHEFYSLKISGAKATR